MIGYKTDEFWRGYPHREMTLELKAYYLLQAAYWIQQTIILGMLHLTVMPYSADGLQPRRLRNLEKTSKSSSRMYVPIIT
jgi:hypothetical protein